MTSDDKDLVHKKVSPTATKETIEHYQRCGKVILSLCKHGDYRCSLIGDKWRWYKVNFEEKKAKLLLACEENYDYLIQKHRTLYWTLQLWSPEIENETRPWIQKSNGKWGIDTLKEGPLGTRKETQLMCLSVDIDRAKDKEVTEPNVKKWLEAALKLFADYFKSISFQSYALFFSGGGGYVMVHPRVTAIGEDEKHDIVYRWEIVQQSFDIFISKMQKQFFKKYPEAKEWVKGFDCLNKDAKRQFKFPLSIHLTQPFAVIPLDKDNPTIDFEKARLPISDEVIGETADCLQFYEGDEERFGKHIIKVYADKAKEAIGKRHPINQTFEAVPDTKELDVSKWAPCARNMYNESKVEGKGITRRLAFLANYMRFVGVPREKAYNVFIRKAQEWRGETTNIFENQYDHDGDPKCFIRNCVNFNKESTGYPGMGFGGLGLCTPDDRCKQIKHPLQYHKRQHGALGRGVSIPLKYDGNKLGVLKIKRAANDRLMVSIDGDKITLAEKNVPSDFYTRGWYQDRIFKDVKYGLEDNDFQKFLKDIFTEIENAIKSLPEDELEGVEYSTKGELEDGRFYEEIFRDGEEQFVVYDPKNDTYEYVREIDNGNETIYPYPIGEKKCDSLILADGVEEYNSLVELRKEMLDFGLEEFDPVENCKVFELVILLELTTWIASERMANYIEKFIPILSTRGGSETGKKRFLTVARWLTYRSMYFLKTTKVPTIFRYLSPWGGTLILDEADLGDSRENSDFVEFMNSRADGVPIPRYSSKKDIVELFHSFGMTVLAERSPAADDGYESRKIIFPSDATENPEDYSLIPPQEWSDKGKVLQRKLLLFRLRHLKGEMPSNLTIPNVQSFRVRESLLLLQSLVDEDPGIKKTINEIAKDLEERIVVERSNSLDGLIMNTVYGAVVDDEGYVTLHGVDFEIMRNHQGSNRDGTDDYTTPLTLKTISKSLGDVLSPSEIARRWRGLGQGTRGAAKIDKKRYRGIIQIQNVKRFRKELKKYVVEIDSEELDSKFGIQETLKTGGDKNGEV